jgi:fluoroacetyl-CoA thioesterase
MRPDSGGKVKESLKAGLEFTHKFMVTTNKTVSSLYPEAEEFHVMPEVFATGFLVGFIEWACIKAVTSHLNWPEEQTVGVHINISHLAATPPGLEVTAKIRLLQVDGKRLFFEFEVYDEIEIISQGNHQRAVINKPRFDSRIKEKAEGR